MDQQQAERWGARLDEVTTALESLTGAVDREDELDMILHAVCQHVVHVIPGADMAGVTLVTGDEPETPACTDEKVRAIDAAQYAAEAGPCLQAAATGEMVRVDVASVRERWPEFARSAIGAGVGSYLCAPLIVDQRYSGALNLYGHQDHGFYRLEAQLLELYVTAVKVALRNTRRLYEARQTVEQLREALVSRATIDQAKGILMAARGITPEDAFEALVEQSQHANTKLRDIAEQLVRTVSKPGT